MTRSNGTSMRVACLQGPITILLEYGIACALLSDCGYLLIQSFSKRCKCFLGSCNDPFFFFQFLADYNQQQSKEVLKYALSSQLSKLKEQILPVYIERTVCTDSTTICSSQHSLSKCRRLYCADLVRFSVHEVSLSSTAKAEQSHREQLQAEPCQVTHHGPPPLGECACMLHTETCRQKTRHTML